MEHKLQKLTTVIKNWLAEKVSPNYHDICLPVLHNVIDDGQAVQWPPWHKKLETVWLSDCLPRPSVHLWDWCRHSPETEKKKVKWKIKLKGEGGRAGICCNSRSDPLSR